MAFFCNYFSNFSAKNSDMREIFSVCLLTMFVFKGEVSLAQNSPVYLEGEAQGTTYHITYYDAEMRDFQYEIDSILYFYDKSVSTYDSSSIISHINQNKPNVIVDAYFTTCFLKAKQIWKSTNGAFDPTVYPLVNAFGFGPGKKEKIESKKIDSLLQFVGFEKINLKRNKISKKDPRVCLDFNAFAQGYSVDVIAAFLKSQNIESFLVEIGGELKVNGKQPNGNAWLIGVEQPIDNKTTGNPIQLIVKLEKNQAVATSGNYRRFFVENGIKYVHHIDPKTGYPTKNNLLSATIITDQCIASDATATGVLVMGLEKAKQYLAKHPEIQAYLIYSGEDGSYQTFQTAGFEQLIVPSEN
jgi:thiamine biosynthesis lipoprotein